MNNRWFDAFRDDPLKAVSDLFTGRAGVGSDMRLDVPELLHQWFPPNLAEERMRLDDAMLSWLRKMQNDYASMVQRLGFSVYGKRVGDALIALQLLDLPQARSAIRADLDAWLRWLLPLRLAPERDPALECYQLLTQDQPNAGHMAMWLRLAVDYREEYLTVALVGLRRLPNNGDARQNQVLMLQALLRHAVVRFHDVNGARRFFKRRFAAVRGLFPRAPDHWNGVLDDALHDLEHVEGPVAVDLAAHLREKQVDKRRPASSHQSPRCLPVPEKEWRTVESDIVNLKQPSDILAHQLFDILERNHKYALAAGDSDPLVRTLSNLGSKLLVHHQLGTADMARFGVMIERGLVWEPANPYCWTLWAKWLQVQGRREAQEAILRETLRLFPRDAAAQVELARLLIARGDGCWDEAEYYLCRTTDQAPDDVHAHVVMARLLALRGQRKDAEQTLADFLAGHPDNGDAQEALKKIRTDTGTAISTRPNHHPNDDAGWETGNVGASEVASISLQEVLRRGGLAGEFNQARIAGHNGQTQLIKQESQKGDALAGFYSQWLKLPETPICPPNAWAWAACRHWQQEGTEEAWEQLAKRFPEAAPETRFLRALAWPGSSNGVAPQPLRSENGTLARPIDIAMRDWQEQAEAQDLDPGQREDIACAVMACAAANTPEFVTATALRTPIPG